MPEALISVLTGSGAAGGVLVAMMLGWLSPKNHVSDLKEEIRDLKAAVSAERSRADAATEAARTSNMLLAGIRNQIGSP